LNHHANRNVKASFSFCPTTFVSLSDRPLCAEELEEYINQMKDQVEGLAELLDPAYATTRERQVNRASIELEGILGELNLARERLDKNPNDKKASEELEQILERTKMPLETLSIFFNLASYSVLAD